MSSSAELRAKALREAYKPKEGSKKTSKKRGKKKAGKKRGKRRSSKRSGPNCGELSHAVAVVENARKLLARAYGAKSKK